MRGVRLSRWSMSYFAAAVVALMLAELLWASGLANPLADVGNPWVLVGVHLTTLGFATLLMLGALHQFVPVLTETELASQSASGATFFAVTLGLTLMLLGFLALPGGALPFVPWLLPVGGSLVILGLLVAAVNLGVTLARAWPWTLSAWLVATGLVFLLATVAAGLLLALSLAAPQVLSASVLRAVVGRGLAAHVIGGIGGWLTLTAMGVAYKLLAMFTLSDEHRGALGWIAYGVTALGLVVAWAGRWLGTPRLDGLAWVAVLVGLAAYVVDMRALYRTRKRRPLELNARYGLIPLGFLASLVVVGVVLYAEGLSPRAEVAVVFWALYGWLGGLAMTQLYKIVPFLTWLNAFGQRLGKGRVPRVQDLVDEHRDHYAYLVYFAAVALGGLFLYLGWFGAFRGALALAFLATVDMARALYHGAHPASSG